MKKLFLCKTAILMACFLLFGLNAKAQTFVPDPTVALESFTQFEVQFDNVNTEFPNGFDYKKTTITILKNGEAYDGTGAELDCDKTNYKGIVKIKYSESITAAGEYTFQVPEGAFSYYDENWNPTTSPAFEVTYTVGVQEPEPEPEPEVANVTFTPDPAVNQESLAKFEVRFADMAQISNFNKNVAITILKDGEVYTAETAEPKIDQGNNCGLIQIKFESSLTESGVYTFQVSEGAFTYYNTDFAVVESPAFEVTYTVGSGESETISFEPVSVTPAVGSVVDNLSSVTLQFSHDKFMLVNNMRYSSVEVYDSNGNQVVEQSFNQYAKGSNYTAIEFMIPPITIPGEYTFVIKEGSFNYDNDFEKLNPEYRFTYTVPVSYEPVSVTPAVGTVVESLSSVTLQFSHDKFMLVNGMRYSSVEVYDSNGNKVVEQSFNQYAKGSNYTAIEFMVPPVTKSGEYTFVIKEGSFNYDNDFEKLNPEYRFTYNVVATEFVTTEIPEVVKEITREATIEVPVILTSANPMTAFQCDVTLSEGLSLEEIALTDRKGADHELTVAQQADGSYKLLCYSLNTLPFGEGNGALFNVKATVRGANDVETVRVSNIMITSTTKKYLAADVEATINVKNYTLGDANEDGSVDVTDIVSIAGYILGNAPEGFYALAADYNEDGSIDVFDIVNIATAILNENAAAEVYSPNASREAEEMLQLTANVNSSTIAVGVDSNESLSAYQMDLYLPNGVEVINITSNDATHSLSYKVSGNKVRVISYSLSLAEISDNANLFNIELSSNVSEEILINNILFSDSEGHGKKAEAMSINPSGIDNVNGEVSIYAENGKIVIESNGNGVADVVSVDGVARRYTIEEGRNEIMLEGGIYIVRFNNKTTKLVI